MSLSARFASSSLVLLLLGAGCAHSTWAPIDPGLEPGLWHYPDAHQIVLLEEQAIRYHLDEKTGKAVSDITTRIRRRFLTPESERPDRIVAHYNRAFSKVLSFRGRVVRPDGTSEDLDASKKVDAPAYTSNLLDDERRITLPVPTLAPGSILEEETVIRETELRLGSIQWTFGQNMPVVHSRLTITAPEGWDLEWLAKSPTAQLDPTITRANGEVTRTWELDHIDPIVREPGGDVEPLLSFVRARLKSWREGGVDQHASSDAREYSAWMYDFARGRDVASAELLDTVKQLVAEAGPDPRQRAIRLHRFVCEQIDYCSVQLGYGGFTPALAKDVFQGRYGDCKGKANLLKTMLKLAGIESRLALVYVHDGFPRPFMPVQATANFNHMILQVELPDGPLLVDPTATTLPFGVLQPGEIDADVLPLQPGGADLIRVPDPEPDASRDHLSVELAFSSGGTLRGTFHWKLTGASAARVRAVVLGTSGETRERAITQMLPFDGAGVSKLEVQGAQHGDSTLEVTGRIALTGALRGNRSAAVLRLSSLGRLGLPALSVPLHGRRTPYAFSYRDHEIIDLSLALPPDIAPSELPASFALERPSGQYALAWSLDDHKLKAHRELTWTRRITPAAEFEQLVGFVADAEKADSRGIVLRAATPKLEVNR